MVSRHDYELDALGRRTGVVREDGRQWNWQYDSRGQVVAGSSVDGQGHLRPGLSFGYQYDAIGNRTASVQSGTQAGEATFPATTYAHRKDNTMNLRVNPGLARLRGLAHPNAAVEVNGPPPVTREPGAVEWGWQATVDNSAEKRSNKLADKLLLTLCAGVGGDGVGAGSGSGQHSGGWWYGAGGGPGHCTGQAAEEGSFRAVIPLAAEQTEGRWLRVVINTTLEPEPEPEPGTGGTAQSPGGWMFAPPTTFSPVPNLAGNLVEGVRWVYAWDAESPAQPDSELRCHRGSVTPPLLSEMFIHSLLINSQLFT